MANTVRRAHYQTTIYRTESFVGDAFSEVDQLRFLLSDNVLHRLALISSLLNAWVFEIEIEAV